MNLLSARTSEVLRSAQLRAKLAEVWALHFSTLICENCDHEVIEYHNRLKEMARKQKKENPNRGKKYLLKPGRFVSINNRTVNRDTMTDEEAAEYLRRYPTALKFFDLVEDEVSPDVKDIDVPNIPDDFVFPDDLDNIGPE